MSNPFDGDETGEEPSGSIRRLLRMRKWIAAVCVPLLFYHFGYLNVDALVAAVPAISVPETAVIDFLFWSAQFQAVVFGLALYQFFSTYPTHLDKRTLHDVDAASRSLAKEEQRLADAIKAVRNRGGKDDHPDIRRLEAEGSKARHDHELFLRSAFRIRLPEVAQDFLRLAPTAMLWATSSIIHLAWLAGLWAQPA